MPPTSTLSPKRQRFVTEYLVDSNATAAAKRAGYSPHTAMQQGSRLLRNVEVQQAVAAGTVAVAERVELDAEWVRTQFRRVADDPAARDADRIAATREIGKLLGLYVERSIHLNAFVRPELQGRTIEELEAIEALLWPERAKPAIDGEGRVLEEGAG